jgi:hypothetical protein
LNVERVELSPAAQTEMPRLVSNRPIVVVALNLPNVRVWAHRVIRAGAALQSFWSEADVA